MTGDNASRQFPEYLRCPDEVVQFVRAACAEVPDVRDALLVIGLDTARQLHGLATNTERFTLECLRARELVDLGAELEVGALILVQFVGPDAPEPSWEHVRTFHSLASACEAQGVRLADCILMSGRRWWSMGEMTVRAAQN
jgi:DNA repair protein RadC